MSEPTLPDQSGPAPEPALSDQERAQLQRSLSFPLDLPSTFVGWMEERMKLLLTADNILGLAQRVAVTGDVKVIAKDLTAQTGLYVWEDAQGTWLYLNGNSFTAGDYPDLNTFLGGTTLPDTRGRSLWLCGTNAAVDLFDNDGVAESSRQPKHTHSDTLSGSLSGATAASDGNHSHTYTRADSGSAFGGPGGGGPNQSTPQTSTDGAHTHSVSGSVSISGSVGSGMAGSDAVAHIVLGSALIKT